MNKTELVETIAVRTELSKKDVDAVLGPVGPPSAPVSVSVSVSVPALALSPRSTAPRTGH